MAGITENGTKSLAARLCAVMGELETIPKSGFNSFHNYHYATDADVTAAVRPLLAKHGIAVIPSVHTHEQQMVEGKNRNGEPVTSYHTRVGAKLILMSEDGETMEMDWYGEADDSGDKGTYKAYTGLLKTGLAKLLQIDTGDDPEADTKTDERAAERSSAERKPRGSSGAERPAEYDGDPLRWRFPFGKHKGQSILQVEREEPQYLEWAWANMDKMPPNVKEALGHHLGKIEIPAPAMANVPGDDDDPDLPF